MADFPAQAPANTGTTLTERSGAAQGTDTVPAGCTLVVRNTGAGTHTVVLTPGYLFDGLAVATRSVSVAAGAATTIKVPANYGNANSRVPVHIGEGTQSEVKIYVLAV